MWFVDWAMCCFYPLNHPPVCLWWLLCSECAVCRCDPVHTLAGQICVCAWSLIDPRWALNVIHTVMTTDLALLTGLELTGCCLQAAFTFRENRLKLCENRWSLRPRICCGLVLKAECEEDCVFCVRSVQLLLELGAIWGFGRAEVLHQFEKRAKKKNCGLQKQQQLFWWCYQ